MKEKIISIILNASTVDAEPSEVMWPGNIVGDEIVHLLHPCIAHKYSFEIDKVSLPKKHSFAFF